MSDWRAEAWRANGPLGATAGGWCLLNRYPNPVLFPAYGIANVFGVIPVIPGGLGIIDTVTPSLPAGFGPTGGVATLGCSAGGW